MMDYRELLKKYIKHVQHMEGVDFIDGYPFAGETFTREEWDELEAICCEPASPPDPPKPCAGGHHIHANEDQCACGRWRRDGDKIVGAFEIGAPYSNGLTVDSIEK